MKFMASYPSLHGKQVGKKVETVTDLFSWAPKSLQMVTAPWNWKQKQTNKKHLFLGKKAMTNPRQCIKGQRYHFADKGLSCHIYGFSRSHVQIWELEHKENWVLKNWCFWTVVLEKSFESLLDCKEIKPVQFSSVQSLSRVWLFVTPWISACQASLSITNSRSSLRLTSIESVMPFSHLILCCPLLLLPPIPPSIRVFSNESTLRMRWPKNWSLSFSIIPSKEIPGLISLVGIIMSYKAANLIC